MAFTYTLIFENYPESLINEHLSIAEFNFIKIKKSCY